MQIDMLDAKKTAMIVVDMQNDFVAAGAAMETPAAREVVPKIAEALKVCRDAKIKVIYTAHMHRRARDAMFRNYRVVFLSDATATYDYPDRGWGPMPAAEVHRATLVILAVSTAHVMSVNDMKARITNRPGLGPGAMPDDLVGRKPRK